MFNWTYKNTTQKKEYEEPLTKQMDADNANEQIIK